MLGLLYLHHLVLWNHCGSVENCCKIYRYSIFRWVSSISWLNDWVPGQKCVSKLTVIGSDKGLAPDRQAIIWTNAGTLLTGTLKTNFNEILIEIHTFSFNKMHLKISSGKCWPVYLGPNVLISCVLFSEMFLCLERLLILHPQSAATWHKLASIYAHIYTNEQKPRKQCPVDGELRTSIITLSPDLPCDMGNLSLESQQAGELYSSLPTEGCVFGTSSLLQATTDCACGQQCISPRDLVATCLIRTR